MSLSVKGRTRYWVRSALTPAGENAMYLNIWGETFKGDTQPVKLHQKVEEDPLQKWLWYGKIDEGVFMVTLRNKDYGLNMNSNDNPSCTIYKTKDNENDGLLKLVAADDDNKLYYIKLVNQNLYLTATGNERGSECVWSKLLPGNDAQKWCFEEAGTN